MEYEVVLIDATETPIECPKKINPSKLEELKIAKTSKSSFTQAKKGSIH
jgi:hypothetical protein